MQLLFDVNAQTLKRTDKNNPATDSVDYLTAKFTFSSPEWNGVEKIALFSAGDVLKRATINSSGECVVPWEVLVKDTSNKGRVYGDSNRFYVSVVGLNGAVQIPTVTVRVDLGESGYGEGTESEDPTPDLYTQFVAEVKGYADSVEAFASEIKGIESGIKDSYANAFKGEASGEVVRVDDVSPVEHNPTVRVYGKNLFYSNIDKWGTLSGISYNIAKNTSAIVFSGVATQENALHTPDSFSLPKGTYTVSVVGLNSEDRVYLRNQTKGEVIVNHIKPSMPKTFTLTEDAEIRTYIVFKENSTYDNTSVCIQIEKGETVTEYTPYVDPTTVKVTRCGKNLLPYPFTDGTVTRKGVTFTDNGDGTLTVDGTAEATTSFVFFYGALHIKGKYTLSGMRGGSGSTYYIQPLGKKTYPGLTDGSKVYEFDGSLVNRLQLTIVAGAVLSNVKIPLMLEKGESATEYERYNGSTVTPNADGSVDITSLSPTMTLLTDTEGVTIDLEYNRDTTVVIGDIESALNTLNEIADSLIGGASE